MSKKSLKIGDELTISLNFMSHTTYPIRIFAAEILHIDEDRYLFMVAKGVTNPSYSWQDIVYPNNLSRFHYLQTSNHPDYFRYQFGSMYLHSGCFNIVCFKN